MTQFCCDWCGVIHTVHSLPIDPKHRFYCSVQCQVADHMFMLLTADANPLHVFQWRPNHDERKKE